MRSHCYSKTNTAARPAPRRYVYQRLLDDGRPADLLLLPPAFHGDLKAFLAQAPQHAGLLWPLLMRAGEWEGAAEAAGLDAQAHKVGRARACVMCP